MFEKEAYEWTEKNISTGRSMYNPSIDMFCEKSFKDGAVLRYCYKGELILSMKQKIYQAGALEVKAEMIIEKGDW